MQLNCNLYIPLKLSEKVSFDMFFRPKIVVVFDTDLFEIVYLSFHHFS